MPSKTSDEEQDVRARLRRAALELFGEHGFGKTTAAQIAGRAGVTERTFFRYFADKREVLFEGQATLQAMLLDAVAEAPPELGEMDTLRRAFESTQAALEANRTFSMPRHAIIANTPELQERELAKIDALAVALAGALKLRGATNLRAVLAAQTGMAAFVYVVNCWLDEPALGLGERLSLAFDELSALLNDASS